ncbi:dihydrofolate reductase [Paenibacillus sophorae]|uniref:Dihydrofolate reductase n=1 Tax=Paenibacillus sophorae TaxID=1333845 RepID=A0A1H8GID7_9BACL|nr:dihydrofolate reductase [Paenibacillus sophorae]QWU14217.1 dihydrofolate reductase [Paenibacillus sophorae]SEN43078.1 dihydrofolate reductase [Paenibacillus sophorae]
MTYPISLIAAMDINNLIGSSNSLPWNISADLKFFKSQTEYGNVVMGRSTYESIGRPLPKRNNIILTSNKNYKVPECTVYDSVDDILVHSIIDELRSTYIIGGASIYKQFLPHIGEMYITHIDAEFEGDTYFPEIDWSEWEAVHSLDIPVGDDTDYPIKIVKYSRLIK